MNGVKRNVEVLSHIVKYCEKLTYNVKVVDGDYNKFIDKEHNTIDMRNRMAHGYEEIDVIVLRTALLEDIPILNERCRVMLRALDSMAEARLRAALEIETTIYDPIERRD